LVTLPADPHQVTDWALIATLRHRAGQSTSVQLARESERIDKDAWSRSEGWCEHCRKRRARRTTYLLRHVDGRLAQVGSSCLAEFIGHPHPMRVLSPTTGPHRSHRGHQRSPVSGREPVEYVDASSYLAHVAQAVLDGCFVSATAATRQRPATWSQAAAALDQGHVPGARAERRAKQALAWAREELARRDRPDEFERRLVLVVGKDRLTRRELPTAGAIIYAYHQHLRRQIAARKKAGEHIGEPGETIVASLTVRRVDRIATPDGPVHRHFLTDRLGRRAIWDADEERLSVGARLAQAIVVAHTAADGRPVTILDHCESVE
jgi:hypothetical protein